VGQSNTRLNTQWIGEKSTGENLHCNDDQLRHQMILDTEPPYHLKTIHVLSKLLGQSCTILLHADKLSSAQRHLEAPSPPCLQLSVGSTNEGSLFPYRQAYREPSSLIIALRPYQSTMTFNDRFHNG
jgi:hypothetical protein